MGKNPILVGYVVLGIGSVAWLSVYLKVSGYYNHIKDHLIAKPNIKESSKSVAWLSVYLKVSDYYNHIKDHTIAKPNIQESSKSVAWLSVYLKVSYILYI